MSRKRSNLQSVTSGAAAKSPETTPEKEEQAAETGASYTPPSRRGQKAVTAYLDPDAVRQLKHIAADEDTTTQALMKEALNELFRSRGKGRIA
jgi:hypothetical protein